MQPVASGVSRMHTSGLERRQGAPAGWSRSWRPHLDSRPITYSGALSNGCSTSYAIEERPRPGIRRCTARAAAHGNGNGVWAASTATVTTRTAQEVLEAEVAELKRMVYAQQRTIAELKDMLSERSALGAVRRLTREEYERCPDRIFLIRHGESQGNVDACYYTDTPDHQIPLTLMGREQARAASEKIRSEMESLHSGPNYKLFFMTSPYCRTLQTCEAIATSFHSSQVQAVKQAVQLREQDFGNFQDADKMQTDLSERDKFGRFWYRFPNGESGADVYDRMTIFEDHLARDMVTGRFRGSSLVLVTHGLTLRIFLMRWFHWTVTQFLEVWNPRNAEPVMLQKLPWEAVERLQQERELVHVKHLYHVPRSEFDAEVLRGCTPSMCTYLGRSEVHSWDFLYQSGGPCAPACHIVLRPREQLREAGIGSLDTGDQILEEGGHIQSRPGGGSRR